MAAQEKEISRLAKSLPDPSNTMIDRKILIKRSSLWQSHLKNIADYLSPGPGPGPGCWWQWTDDGSVEFRDGPQEEASKPAGSSPCHFRSTTIKFLHEVLEVEWEEVTQNPDHLPLVNLRDKEGKLLYNRMQQSADASYFQQGTPDIQSSNTLPPTNEQDTSYGLEAVLGGTPVVYGYEKCRNTLARNPGSHYSKAKYESQLAQIQVDVLKSVTKCKENVLRWETELEAKNDCVPTEEDYRNCTDIFTLVKKQKIASKLLQSWNMTVHL